MQASDNMGHKEQTRSTNAQQCKFCCVSKKAQEGEAHKRQTMKGGSRQRQAATGSSPTLTLAMRRRTEVVTEASMVTKSSGTWKGKWGGVRGKGIKTDGI